MAHSDDHLDRCENCNQPLSLIGRDGTEPWLCRGCKDGKAPASFLAYAILLAIAAFFIMSLCVRMC